MTISLLLIAGDSEPFVAAASGAARVVFPGSSIRSAPSLEKAMEMSAPGVPEILAIREASTPDIERATQALDSSHLPRWAVVASGGSPPVPSAEVIPGAEWKPEILARVFRFAMELHLLRRERDCLLGDLLTIGTRITHDLRTPIGGIMTATEALNETHVGQPDPMKELVQPINDSVRDLVAIVGQVSLLSKATARQVASQDFSMEKAASRAVMRVEARAAREGATLVRPDSWPDVRGDPSHSESIWHILLENALDHSGERPRIEIGWEPADEGFRFWVRDQGRGVPSESRGLLFQPFHSLHDTSAVRGLGLAIMERLVALQGGRCGYEERSKGGASFFFTLPSVG